jgi:hypothetical protein
MHGFTTELLPNGRSHGSDEVSEVGLSAKGLATEELLDEIVLQRIAVHNCVDVVDDDRHDDAAAQILCADDISVLVNRNQFCVLIKIKALAC